MALYITTLLLQNTFAILTIILVTIGVICGVVSHKKSLRKYNEALLKLKQDEEYITKILNTLPSSGDVSLDTYRRITLDTQLRGILEQKRASELKEKEIQTSINNAINVASAIQNQTIHNYNGGNK